MIIDEFSWSEFISIIPRLLISIWLINSALTKFDFTKLSWLEVFLRLALGFLILLLDFRIQIICILGAIILISWDFYRYKKLETKLT